MLKLWLHCSIFPAAEIFITDLTTLQTWKGANLFTVDVYCTDGTFTAGPHAIKVQLTYQIAAPHFVNLPNTVTIPEDFYYEQIYEVLLSQNTLTTLNF